MSQFIHPITQLVHSTVRIECTDSQNRTSSGTGYIFMFCETEGTAFPCVVTNKHVTEGAIRGVFHLTLKNEDGTPALGTHEAVVLNELDKHCILHPSTAIDLVAFPIGPILNNASKDGRAYYFVPLSKQMLASNELLESLPPMEEIVMIGYPNGLWDKLHNLPIIRKGITATHPKLKLNGKPEFLIDAACFPGSSGSPVFLANIGSFVSPDGSLCAGTRVALLGTLYAGPQHTTSGEIIVVDVPTDTKQISIGSIPNNLGYVIQASELLILEDAVKEALQPVPKVPRNALCPCGSGKRFKRCCGLLG
ncbi:SEC-C metal-binding domain-containing protein [Kluyvera cryocrescens]|uniref:SEC-C metal-binding domain-containing protein n=1 Tax=Kluyvera cryocrescens TaxID=580 RepID=UPI002DB62328|nr:SEC-C metal-binding domain-containing protein [Kluyvera cryocrescens]MEB6633430.1 SEC-C domain-containing protein [Kluyvera cryocrescens]